MAKLSDVLRHLITHAEGYATPALRQEHLDVADHLEAAEASAQARIGNAAAGEDN